MVLSFPCLSSSWTCSYLYYVSFKPHSEVSRFSNLLGDLLQLSKLLKLFHKRSKNILKPQLSYPPPLQKSHHVHCVRHLAIAKQGTNSPRKTGNLPLRTGHLKIDKMLSYAVYHWHTAWNLKEIMLWTSNTSLKIENILLASVVGSFWLGTAGVLSL